MARVEIDLESFGSTLTEAIAGAIKSVVEGYTPERLKEKKTTLPKTIKKIVNRKTVEIPIEEAIKEMKEKKKPGRPKKKKPLPSQGDPSTWFERKSKSQNVKIGDMEEKIEDILNYEVPLPISSPAKQNYIVAAKRVNSSGSPIKNIANAQSVVDPNRKMKFIDDPAVGDKINPSKYPPRSDRRPPAIMGKFKCDVCHRDFEGSYGEFPQALLKFKDPTAGVMTEERALVKCNDCSTRPTR